jgi:CubicO group peptidase (beta-lactamase class C family)
MEKNFCRLVFTVAMAITVLSGCHVGRFFVYNFANISDHKKFSSRPLSASRQPFQFAEATVQIGPKEVSYKGETMSFEEYLDKQGTVAFLIIRRDTILYENYFHGYAKEDVVVSFSMAKSVTSMLVGCAIEDGLIASVDDPITKYLPGLKDPDMVKVKIKHLLQMTSGIDFNESYVNPLGEAAKFYYGRHLDRYCAKLKCKVEPGTDFNYVSGDTQLLGALLQKVLNGKSITDYLEERVWGKLGMEYSASWSTDRKDGTEKTFCCLNARARDFAKFGRLYLKKGNWEGEQLVPAHWVEQSTKVDEAEGSAWFYQYQWWIPNRSGAFMAEGILGQYVYVYPEKELIIVRLGKKAGNSHWSAIFDAIAGLEKD